MSKQALHFLLLFLLMLLVAPTAGFALTETEVSESLLCYSCPGEPLNVCTSGCGDQMRSVISRMINEGKDKSEILDYFVAQFSESILTNVPKRGFNLVAYAGPFVGLLVGIPLALLIIRRWGAAGRELATDNGTVERTVTLDEKTRLQIEKELSELDKEN